jgi:predicted DNA-binding transcriptional regulator AlpA
MWPVSDKLLLKSKDAAALLDISRTLLYQLTVTGEIGPKPYKLGRCSLWDPLELKAWVASGCPAREQWLRMRAAEKKDEENRN